MTTKCVLEMLLAVAIFVPVFETLQRWRRRAGKKFVRTTLEQLEAARLELEEEKGHKG